MLRLITKIIRHRPSLTIFADNSKSYFLYQFMFQNLVHIYITNYLCGISSGDVFACPL